MSKIIYRKPIMPRKEEQVISSEEIDEDDSIDSPEDFKVIREKVVHHKDGSKTVSMTLQWADIGEDFDYELDIGSAEDTWS